MPGIASTATERLLSEIIAMILDYLPIPDLMAFSKTSKRFQEMVYDDTRWIAKLRAMGVWDETAARQRFEEQMRRKMDAQKTRQAEEARRNGGGHMGSANGSVNGGTTRDRQKSVTLFDVGWEEQQQHKISERSRIVSQDQDTISADYVTAAPSDILYVFERYKSARGAARLEYAKIYGTLAPFYLDLTKARTQADPRVFRSFRDPEQQARMLAQLRIFARGDTTYGFQHREEKLESMIAIFENAVLREFEQGCEANDVDGRMTAYANVLVTLNGGASGIDLFIHNNRLMLEKEKLGSPQDAIQELTAGRLSLCLATAHDFFHNLSKAVNAQAALVDRVFPRSVDVMIPFLDRISDDIISDYITPLFDEAHNVNIESYLKIVAGVYEQNLQFIKSLHPSEGSKLNFETKLTDIVNRNFEPHIDLYLQEELDYFRQKSSVEIDVWDKSFSEQEASTEMYLMSNINRQAVKQDFLTSFKKVLMTPITAIPISSPFSKPAAADLAITTDTTLAGDDLAMPAASARPEAPTTELAAKAAIMNSKLEGIGTLFSIEVALKLVHLAKTSLERAALFAQLGGQSGAEAKEQCEAIFVHLLQTLGQRHIKPGFDRAVTHLSQYSAREASSHARPGAAAPDSAGVKPLVTFLELVNVGDLIQQMVDVFYAQELVAPRLTDRDDFLAPPTKEKKRFEQLLDERVAAGLNGGIDVLVDEIEWICATTQQTADYNPEAAAPTPSGSTAAGGAMALPPLPNIGATPTALRVVALVSTHTSMLAGSTDRHVLDVFTQEVGLRLFAALCKHIKRQRVSVLGALRLIADCNAYAAFAQSLRNRELLRYFAALRELVQLFLVDGRDAKEIAAIVADADRYRGIFRAEEVYEFAQRRADWYNIKRNVERAMYGFGCAVM